MRAYTATSEEALHARDLLKDWASEGLVSEVQYRRMEQDTRCDLRRTNIFLRLVLFLFTLIIAGAATGLFFRIFFAHSGARVTGICLLVFAAMSYAGAEIAVSQGRLYRYGIEEALAAFSVAFLCAGIGAALSGGPAYVQKGAGTAFLVPAAGAIASLCIWRRFGLMYAFLAAMIFVAWLPGYWTPSRPAQHLMLAAFYGAGLAAIAPVRSRYGLTCLDDEYSMAEALLWLGIYLAINVQLSSVDALRHWWSGAPAAAEFPRTFYWATWALTWCLPPTVLARGVRRKDRFVMATGAIAAILTLITNKPYLGWQRHTWDPMVVGAFLIGVALFVRRWMACGPCGVRNGFTARRLSAKDKGVMNAASAGIGLASPNSIRLNTQAGTPAVHFGGGDFGGGGASSDF